ncbi:binding-protein-dependent transport systems inner membrane component [Thermobaculum terrenum ATCC BAA-798]|uniref:Binding-protein-dependent transport systems inner membrane component n=1 Tax=Thermobaculum terrenum (strain ATCC BAA-798 / CCMEE 7001 / YNP1) TaxID=525904 RepID=D1CI19_THET1|nr:sugar ABC transporter permease [Thermobaculum terrenum]ACZ43390.1 binding-protein-dependent transport systems inner membrane component [Thermobaculum terrenum ATCC BAA-798]
MGSQTQERVLSQGRAVVGGASWRRRRLVLPWLFVLPALGLNLVVMTGPAVGAIYYSFTDWSGVGQAHFVGLDNYRRMLETSSGFWSALAHNLLYMGFFLTVPMVMALVASSLLAPIRRGAMLYRIGLFLPYVLPSVVTAFIWQSLMDPDLGLGALVARWTGFRGLAQPFLGQPSTALPAIAFVDNWHWWGFLMVLFLTAMQGIPADLYETARIEGANRWQEFWYVTLPGIRPTVALMILMTSIWSFLVFDYVWILTQGGPAGASEVLATLVYKAAFQNFQAGYAAAIGLTMSLLAGVVITIFVVLRWRGWEI